MAKPSKQFGLLVPEKNKVFSRPSIFNEDSDSDKDDVKPTATETLKKKERLAQEKAIAEDPTVYQYDELYDDMESKRKESKLARKDLDKKPKYISKLLESAERRKRENERRIERQVQKEREEEGDMFKDKESFVTTAYRKKLEELKELEEKEKREEYLESIGDVKKQGDLSGFYRHLYAQQVNFEGDKKDEVIVKEEQTEEAESQESETHKAPELVEPVKKKQKTTESNRKYRKRENSKSSENESETEQKLQHLPSNLDADSDFSIDSDSETEAEAKKSKTEEVTIKEEIVEQISEEKTDIEQKNEVKVEVDGEAEKTPEEPKKPKKDIWKKRTVGTVFDEALQRYYERKTNRIMSV